MQDLVYRCLVYHYLYDFKVVDKNILLNKLKLHKNWEYLEMLKYFDDKIFIDNNIKEIGLCGLINITNKLVDKFKDKELNKNTKLLNFIKNVNTFEDINEFYNNFSIYFKKKSEKHLKKFEYIITEVIEDLNGNRPFNEDYRNKINEFLD